MIGQPNERLSARINKKMEEQSSTLAASTESALRSFENNLTRILTDAENSIWRDTARLKAASAHATSRTIWRLEWISLSSPWAFLTVLIIACLTIAGAIILTNAHLKETQSRSLNAFGMTILTDQGGTNWIILSPENPPQSCELGKTEVLCILAKE